MNLSNKYYPSLNIYFITGKDKYFLYNFNTKEVLSITKKEAEKLSSFSTCQTLDEYAEQFIDDEISFILDKNLIQQFDLLLKTKADNIPDTKNNKKNITISIITNNRPEFLKISAESIASQLIKNKMDVPITVFDDSVETKIFDQNISLTEKTKKDLYPNIFYFGKKEKESFLDNLLKKINNLGIEREVLDFAIYGKEEFKIAKGPGGNRNISILKSAGKKLISFDDDIEIIPKGEKKKTASSPYGISFEKNPEINLFDDIKKAEKIISYCDTDLITSFFETTGACAADLLESAMHTNGKINNADFTKEIGYSIEKTGGKIIAAMSGIYGGRWFSRIGKIFTNDGEFRTSSYKDKSAYNKIKKNPIATLLSSSVNLSNIPFFVASACSIDLSQGIMPPFPPLGRNEDSIWALLALYINKNSFIAFLPTAVFHSESNKNDFTEKNYSDTLPDMGLINFLIIDYLKTRESLLMLDPSLPYIGRQLGELASCSDKDWLDFCNMVWMKYTGGFIEELENTLDFYRKKPKYWAADVTEYIELLEKQILVPANSLPSEFIIGNTIEGACKLHKLCLKQYGKLLEAWPLIMEAARNLSDGERG